MRKFMFVTAAALSSTLMSVSAQAAAFQGPYIGLEAGINRDKIGDTAGAAGFGSSERHATSFAGGVFAGYNATIAPRVVVGGEVALDATSADSISNGAGGEAAVLDPKRQINVTGRAGYLVDQQTLAYVRGGYSNVRADISSNAQNGAINRSRDLGGWTLGAGVERKLSSTVSARVEYRYADFGGKDHDFDRHQVLAAIAYHF